MPTCLRYQIFILFFGSLKADTFLFNQPEPKVNLPRTFAKQMRNEWKVLEVNQPKKLKLPLKMHETLAILYHILQQFLLSSQSSWWMEDTLWLNLQPRKWYEKWREQNEWWTLRTNSHTTVEKWENLFCCRQIRSFQAPTTPLKST